MSDTKKCRRCSKEKPIVEFQNKVNSKNRFGVFCSTCKEALNDSYRKRYRLGEFKQYDDQRSYRQRLLSQEVPPGQQRCKKCLKLKPESDFSNASGRTPDGKSNYCEQCRDYQKNYMRKSRTERTEEQRARYIARAKEMRDGRKRTIIEAYGGKCSCCGITEIEFLQIDHIEPIGHKQRLQTGEWGNRFYLSLIRRGFPDGYRILCANCNSSYGYFGYCPHQQVAVIN